MDYGFLENKIIPVVVLKDLDETLVKLNALSRGGIRVAEITFRTACAKEAIKLASKECKDMLIGAGTVINAVQCRDAIDAGAKFIVSPGLSKSVYKICVEKDVPYLGGVVTPTEIIAAKDLGLNVMKFFPSEAFGGVKTLKAVSAAFPDVRFVPTGGVNAGNLKDYLTKSFVSAVGGSWMLDGTAEEIENMSREAMAIASGCTK